MYTIISIVCSIKVKLLKKKWDHVWSRIANKHLLRVKWKRVANCYKNRRKNPEDGRQSSLFVRNTVYPPCDKGGVRALVKSTTRAKKRIFKIGWRAREKELVHFVGTSPLLFWFLAKKGFERGTDGSLISFRRIRIEAISRGYLGRTSEQASRSSGIGFPSIIIYV